MALQQGIFIDSTGLGVATNLLVTAAGTLATMDDYPQVITYNTDGTINYVTTTIGLNQYRQTYTYMNGALTSLTGWVKQ